jgi:hypothetical protein
MAAQLRQRAQTAVLTGSWYRQPHPTFTDTLAAVRRQIWCEAGFLTSRNRHKTLKPSPALQRCLAYTLCHAARLADVDLSWQSLRTACPIAYRERDCDILNCCFLYAAITRICGRLIEAHERPSTALQLGRTTRPHSIEIYEINPEDTYATRAGLATCAVLWSLTRLLPLQHTYTYGKTRLSCILPVFKLQR